MRSAHCRCLNLQELITLPQDSPPSAHCNPLRQRQNQPTKMQETHNQACARAILVTYHRSQTRPSYATTNTTLLLLLLEGNHNASENTAHKQALSHLALSHSRFLTALRQPPPHPAAKEFSICIHTLACSHPPRLCAFVRTNWATKNKGQHG